LVNFRQACRQVMLLSQRPMRVVGAGRHNRELGFPFR
jgi:hypothetical protein